MDARNKPNATESAATSSFTSFASALAPTEKIWGCPPDFVNKSSSRQNFWQRKDSEDNKNNAEGSERSGKLQWGSPPEFGRPKQQQKHTEEKTPLDVRSTATVVDAKAMNGSGRRGSAVWVLPPVPDTFKNGRPPHPAYKQLPDGKAFLCFFTKIYAFSNHYPAFFSVCGATYCCSEQYYMFHKAKWFGFNVTAEDIMEVNDASIIKRMGTADTFMERWAFKMEPNAREFDHDEWKNVKEDIMLAALRAKFTQNKVLSEMLMATNDSLLVEASRDSYWGIGHGIDAAEMEDTSKWRGENRLGILLMRIRLELQLGKM